MPIFTPQSEEFSLNEIVREIFVPKNRQMIVHQQITLKGSVVLEGDLILIN